MDGSRRISVSFRLSAELSRQLDWPAAAAFLNAVLICRFPDGETDSLPDIARQQGEAIMMITLTVVFTASSRVASSFVCCTIIRLLIVRPRPSLGSSSPVN